MAEVYRECYCISNGFWRSGKDTKTEKYDKSSIRKKVYKKGMTYMSKIIIWSWCWLILFLQCGKLRIYYSSQLHWLCNYWSQWIYRGKGAKNRTVIFMSVYNLRDAKTVFFGHTLILIYKGRKGPTHLNKRMSEFSWFNNNSSLSFQHSCKQKTTKYKE